MTIQQDMAALEARIARARSDRDTWRAAGQEEKYLEAYFMIEALEVQLGECMRQAASDRPR